MNWGLFSSQTHLSEIKGDHSLLGGPFFYAFFLVFWYCCCWSPMCQFLYCHSNLGKNGESAGYLILSYHVQAKGSSTNHLSLSVYLITNATPLPSEQSQIHSVAHSLDSPGHD